MKEYVMSLSRIALASFALITLTASIASAEIEADPDKVYHLTRHHGPWMIMVASFFDTGPIDEESTSPIEAANALVLELRQCGLPAYVYEMDSLDSPVMTTNRLGEEEMRRPSHRYHEICVMAGNYSSIEDPVAQETLAWVKRYNIQSEAFTDVVFSRTPGQPAPLSGAFLTVNPILTPEEISALQREEDFRDLASFNIGIPYSLLNNPGNYTLVIATFRGQVIHQGLDPNRDEPSDGRSATVRALEMITGGSIAERAGLAEAARSATQLASHLNVNEEVEAYVWHDQFTSVVTVGSFTSPQDPTIELYRQRFAVQPHVDPTTMEMHGFTQIPVDYGSNEYQMIVYDPVPQLMPVPGAND
jgi:hypothetical protein